MIMETMKKHNDKNGVKIKKEKNIQSWTETLISIFLYDVYLMNA